MKNKEKFMKFLSDLINHDKEFTKTIYDDEIKECIDYLYDLKEKEVKPITDKGRNVITFMVENNLTDWIYAKDLAEKMNVNSRSISGTMSSLAKEDKGYLEAQKLDGKSAQLYRLTQKSIDFVNETGKETD